MKQSKKIVSICVLIILVLSVFLTAAACAAKDSATSGASQTNNQTAGVDESDIVKVTADGYIFKAQTDGITVTKADAGNLDVVVKEAYIGFTPSEMFVTDSLVIVLGDKRVAVSGTSAFMTKSEVKIYDLSKMKTGGAGALLRTSEFFGSFYTARLFENQMYVTFQVGYNDFFGDTDVNYFYDSFEGIKQFEVNSSLTETYTWYHGFILLKFNLDDVATALLTAKFFMGNSISDVYCSPYAIYIISWDYSYYRNRNYNRGCGYTSPDYEPPTSPYFLGYGPTKVTKLSLDDLSVKSELLFGGNILNRYSLFDNGLVLYIASNYYGRNAVFSFDRELKNIGQSEDFARGEDIYSVRFDGEICYVVTFRQTDPLYKIDISDPANIEILGELKIEGYSTHLQTFGDDYLIGLGYETGWGATTIGVKLVLFGVTEDEPEEITSVLFSEDYGYYSESEATYNPKAILCEPDNNIFAFPIEYYKGNYLYQGAIIFGVVDGELKELAFLSNYDADAYPYVPAKNITRIARIGEFLYTISDGYIASYALADFSQIDFVDTRIA